MKKVSLIVLMCFFALTTVVMFQNCSEESGSAQIPSTSPDKNTNWDKYDPYMLPLIW